MKYAPVDPDPLDSARKDIEDFVQRILGEVLLWDTSNKNGVRFDSPRVFGADEMSLASENEVLHLMVNYVKDPN